MKVAGHVQAESQRRDDKRKLTDLGKSHSDAKRRSHVVAGNEGSKRAAEDLAEHDDDGDRNNRHDVFHEKRPDQ